MKGISFGQYYPADSIIHKMDPRFKILIAITLIVGTFLCKSAVSFLALLCIGLTLIFVSKIPIKTMLRSIRPLLFIIGFTCLLSSSQLQQVSGDDGSLHAQALAQFRLLQ